MVAPLALLVLAAAPPAFAGNPNFDNPTGDPRADAPDDPDFDRSESDDASGDFLSGNSVFEEQFELFGFAPETTESTAKYLDPNDPNFLAGQISGVRADTAWQQGRGRADVAIAILDTGVRWNRNELRRKVRLNCRELPAPRPGGAPVAGSSPGCREPGYVYDLTGLANPDDHFGFDVDDYVGDPSVNPNASSRGTGAIDGIDLIRAFSNGADEDGNGYIDDIAGWDFFDGDNDADDVSSYASASNHGSGRAEDAARTTNNDDGGAGVCPYCQFTPLRVWDTFVPDGGNFAQAIAYAADNGIPVTEAAVGVLTNSKFAREVHQYAYERGVALMSVSSDLNTADHNYPTNYNHTIFVSGIVADAEGLGQGGNEFFPPVPIGAGVPVETWFRDSGLTQYGGHHHINMMGDTGSQATGQASGAAGLLVSHARANGVALTADEVKQVLTLTCEDVLPGNTQGIGTADPAQLGWDQHFGYGRIDLDAALTRVASGPIPPEAGLESPPWFAVLDPDPNGDDTLDASFPIHATIDLRGASNASWTLEVGPGIEPSESPANGWTVVASGSTAVPFGHGPGLARPGGVLATIPASAIAAAAFPTKVAGLGHFSAPPLAVGPPIQGDADVPSNEFAFTLRLRVWSASSPTNVGEDRKTLFLHHDPTLHAGWPKFIDVGGESALKMADLDGDNRLDVVVADSGGALTAYDDQGNALPGFPVFAPYTDNALAHANAPVFQTLEKPRSAFLTPAVGDLDRDGVPEIVTIAGSQVFVYQADGALRAGFPVSLNPAFSLPALRTNDHHLKTGFTATPVLGDLDNDGKLEIVAAGLDQRVYAWNDDGSAVPGWPVYAKDPTSPPGVGAEIFATPTLADLDGDGTLDVIVSTNEEYGTPTFDPQQEFAGLLDVFSNPTQLPNFPTQLASIALDQVFANAGGTTRVYAIHSDGTAHDGNAGDDGGAAIDADAFLAGWPIAVPQLLQELLPLVAPGHMLAAADLDLDPATTELVVSATAANTQIVKYDGTTIRTMSPDVAGGDSVDQSAMLDLLSYPAIADFDGDSDLDIIKGMISAAGAANLLLVGQNLPFNHLISAWDAATGTNLPSFPKATDDFVLLSHPVIADVGKPGVAGAPSDGLNEIVTGTGMYLLHAYNPAGVEPAGWPKLTGGWLAQPPVLGDVDGDGLLEVAANTREGNVYVWDTDGPVCGNDQWWTYHHDEWNTGDYRRDTRAPSRVTTLAATSPVLLTVNATWNAPGDDGLCGQASSYQLAWSTDPITPANFDAANAVPLSAPLAPGSPEAKSFAAPQNIVYVGLRARDEAGNPGRLSVTTVKVLPESGGALGLAAGAALLAIARRSRRAR
jgi:subtilase family protein/VCBS repeat protein